ncbi:MAG: outer membrane protein assembly factor BamE [Xanthomonadales bacterium]|nr:outer membrane protein assembly factor BamE [Xanthomonadales bacterium]
MRHRWILLLAFLPLGGCGLLYKLDVQQGNLFDKEQVETLKPGMTKRQVLLVMGSPSVVSPFRQDHWHYVSSIRRGRGKMDSKDLVLTFEGDSLARIEGDYFPEDPDVLIRDARKYKRQYPDEKREDDDKKKREGQG